MEEFVSRAFNAGAALLAGYIFLRVSFVRRYRFEHLRTDRLAIHLFGYSLVLFIAGDFIALVMPDWTPNCFRAAQKDAETAGITPAVVNAMLIGVFAAIADNFRVLIAMWDDPALTNNAPLPLRKRLRLAGVANVICESNDANLRIIFRALMLRKLIMITLKSRKVYVGDPVWPDFDPAHVLTSLKILQLASGSRDEASRKVNLSTDYGALTAALQASSSKGVSDLDRANPLRSDMFDLPLGGKLVPVDIEDFGAVIAWSEIESITIFDRNVYAWFQTQPPPSHAKQPAHHP